MCNNKIDEFAEKPLVTVIICTYNRADILKKCLDSMINQIYDKFEVIVVNGPSTDRTENLIKQYPFRYIQQKNRDGISAARNLGINEAKGEIIAFIDDDAVADKHWIINLVRKYNNETVGGVGGTIIQGDSGKIGKYRDKVNMFGILGRGQIITNTKYREFNTTCGCNTSFRKKVLEEVGGFDAYYSRYFDETDVCVRIAQAGYKIEYESNAVVTHYGIDGPERSNMWYHKAQKELYFTLKNFGYELPIERIVYENMKLYIYDMVHITALLLLFRMNPIKYIQSSIYLITGRIQGYKDGVRSRRKNEY